MSFEKNQGNFFPVTTFSGSTFFTLGAIDSEEVSKNKAIHYTYENKIEILSRKRTYLEHLESYNKINLSLDTFPYPGVTTSFESVSMGTPVLTMKGFNFNSRCGESIMKSANLNNFIATSNEEYIEKAVFFANNIDELEKVRKELFDKVLETSLFDTASFSSDFCEALKNMLNSVNKNYK